MNWQNHAFCMCFWCQPIYCVHKETYWFTGLEFWRESDSGRNSHDLVQKILTKLSELRTTIIIERIQILTNVTRIQINSCKVKQNSTIGLHGHSNLLDAQYFSSLPLHDVTVMYGWANNFILVLLIVLAQSSLLQHHRQLWEKYYFHSVINDQIQENAQELMN